MGTQIVDSNNTKYQLSEVRESVTRTREFDFLFRTSVDDKYEIGKELQSNKFTDNRLETINYQKPSITETIESWFIGSVISVDWNERYFEARLKDYKTDIESIAEFDIDSVFETEEDEEFYLYNGSKFAFSIYSKHGYGSPITVSKLEFSAPYIWKKDDKEKVDQLFKEMFPEEA